MHGGGADSRDKEIGGECGGGRQPSLVLLGLGFYWKHKLTKAE